MIARGDQPAGEDGASEARAYAASRVIQRAENEPLPSDTEESMYEPGCGIGCLRLTCFYEDH